MALNQQMLGPADSALGCGESPTPRLGWRASNGGVVRPSVALGGQKSGRREIQRPRHGRFLLRSVLQGRWVAFKLEALELEALELDDYTNLVVFSCSFPAEGAIMGRRDPRLRPRFGTTKLFGI